MSAVLNILKQIGSSLLAALLTEAFVKRIVVWGLKKLAAKSENKIDDELVEQIEKQLYPESQEPKS